MVHFIFFFCSFDTLYIPIQSTSRNTINLWQLPRCPHLISDHLISDFQPSLWAVFLCTILFSVVQKSHLETQSIHPNIKLGMIQYNTTHCNTLKHVATHCNALQHLCLASRFSVVQISHLETQSIHPNIKLWRSIITSWPWGNIMMLWYFVITLC